MLFFDIEIKPPGAEQQFLAYLLSCTGLHVDVYFHAFFLISSCCQDLVTRQYLHLETGIFRNF